MTLVLVAGLAAMNMSAFLPSLPTMAVYFDTDYSVIQLSVSMYLAVTALLQLAIGPISDRYGRRPVTLTCLGIFTVASVGCLAAPNVETFLIFRMLQGAVAVGLALSRAVVRDLYSQDESASMIGYVTMGMALVPMVAPAIGGILEQAFGWQATFAMLTLSGVAILILCWADQGETSPGDGKTFRDQVKDYPGLLRSRRFWGYVFAAAFASGAFFAFLGGAPFVATRVFGLSAFWSGVAFGVPAIGYALGNFLSGRFSVRFGINWMIQAGAIITTTGLSVALLITLFGGESAPLFFLSCTFVGLGNGLVMPNANAGLLSVRPHLAGTASGLGAAIMIGGGAALSALSGTALSYGGGSLPLLAIMTLSAFLALASILYVERRERTLNQI